MLSLPQCIVHRLIRKSGEISGVDPGFFQRGGCNFENSRQTFQGQGNGGGGRARVMFEYICEFQSWNIYYTLLVIGQVKSDSFGVTKAKLSYKYGLLRTNQIQAFCY